MPFSNCEGSSMYMSNADFLNSLYVNYQILIIFDYCEDLFLASVLISKNFYSHQ